MSRLALLGVLAAACTARAAGVWPQPKSIALEGPEAALAPDFRVFAQRADGPGAARLARALERFVDAVAPRGTAEVRRAAAGSGAASVVSGVSVEVEDASGALGMETNASYTLTVSPDDGVARVSAATVYGAMYALETFAQLVDVERGALAAASVRVADAPAYTHRGLLMDPGRRFVPVPTLQNIIDTMAAVKLNVLHLHLSDFCRFGVESLRYPALTAAVASGPNEGFYSQKEVRALVAYAADRGVRIMPEFEMPGHALGFKPIASPGGLEFCDTCAYGKTGNGSGFTCMPSQLHGTEGTARVVNEVLGEMAALFPDELFHVGADETFVQEGPGERCTNNGTDFLERAVITAVQDDFNKTPAGWEQVLFKTGAATEATVVWSYISPPENTTRTGHRTVSANGTNLYFTIAAPGGPDGWDKLWYDIGAGVPANESALLLGGEMSQWEDTYCSPRECSAMPAYHKEKGGALYTRTRDHEFARSIGGMLWPRGYVGAGSFWGYNVSQDPHSPDFVARIWALNDKLAARGSLVCPSNCTCDQTTACGKPYIQ